jgi:hypothetical protein
MSTASGSLPRDEGKVNYSKEEVIALRQQAYDEGFDDARNAAVAETNEKITKLTAEVEELKKSKPQESLKKVTGYATGTTGYGSPGAMSEFSRRPVSTAYGAVTINAGPASMSDDFSRYDTELVQKWTSLPGTT